MKFTIAIPVYKAKYLKECIESIMCQTYTDYELIIVNDASPDDIESIMSNYTNEKIIYYKNRKNYGATHVVKNWNKCLSYAKGEYFILMGDDDKMSSDYLAEFLVLIEKRPNCNIYHCRTVIINELSEPLQLTEPRPEHESVYDSILQRIRGNRLSFITDYVFKTETLKNNGGFYYLPLAWASDDISSYIATEQNGIAHTNKLLFMYRINSQNISSNGSIYLKMKAIEEEKKWILNFLKKNSSNFTDNLLKESISKELQIYVKKKKIFTLYTSAKQISIFNLYEYIVKLKEFDITLEDYLYAIIMSIKERRKKNLKIKSK